MNTAVNRIITLATILKDSNYSLSIFTEAEIKSLESRIIPRDGKAYINCVIRDKEIQLKPEEIIRQLYAEKLINAYGYPKQRIKFEHPVTMGRAVKSADIVIFDKDSPLVEYIIVEVKSPKLQKGKDQLRGYCHATGAPIGVWTNGEKISHYHRIDPNFFNDITDIPKADQTLEDILKERFTWCDLVAKDKIPNEGKSLKLIIKEMEDEVLANAGVDVFDEVFKLIFTKLYDEMKSREDKQYVDRIIRRKLSPEDIADFDKLKEALKDIDTSDFRLLEFRNTGQTEGELKRKIQKLFDEAKNKWPGVFPGDSKIDLSTSHLPICVSSLQDVKCCQSAKWDTF